MLRANLGKMFVEGRGWIFPVQYYQPLQSQNQKSSTGSAHLEHIFRIQKNQ